MEENTIGSELIGYGLYVVSFVVGMIGLGVVAKVAFHLVSLGWRIL